ncbi:MAG: AraC family transcriptional regulator [Gammaproteobacteria bacterium]|jgi:AraC-like DNA-binding protein|nr:AraC family transcriptional regulator [Gammaproteobacteria bacterium]MBT4491837.1 AraC family transcriptional regulator [Gammaproteobacteria bacterium]
MIRATLARFLYHQATQHGFDALALLSHTGIDETNLENPEYVIQRSQLLQLINNIYQQDPDTDLALQIGHALSIQDLGIMGHALMSCPTLAELHPLWESFHELAGTPIRNHSQMMGDTWVLSFRSETPLGQAEQFCIEQHLGNTLKLSRLLLETPLVIDEVQLTYPEPPYLNRYRELVGCPIRFDQTQNALMMNRKQLSTRVVTADSETFALCVQYCQGVLEQLVDADSMAGRIRLELTRTPGRIPKATEMATSLGYSERKLRRLLQAEGTTYGDVIRQYRQDLAEEYLKNTMLAPKQIAYLLGFDDPSSFRRAFKQWTGGTISDYRSRSEQDKAEP